jgi:hypothetical protein
MLSIILSCCVFYVSIAQPVFNSLSGIGIDGKTYIEKWRGHEILKPREYYIQNETKEFIRFSLNNDPWPTKEWGVEKKSFKIRCSNGGILSGIGSDGKTYTEKWKGHKILKPREYYVLNGIKEFIHFSLNNDPWPTGEWGIAKNSWSVTCK